MRSPGLSFVAAVAPAAVLPSCAGTECNYHSQCEYGYFCRRNRCVQECQIDEDCEDEGLACNRRIGRCEGPDGGTAPPDGGGRDAFTPPPDAGRDAGPDGGGTTGTGA